jgi:hypothetical protein
VGSRGLEGLRHVARRFDHAAPEGAERTRWIFGNGRARLSEQVPSLMNITPGWYYHVEPDQVAEEAQIPAGPARADVSFDFSKISILWGRQAPALLPPAGILQPKLAIGAVDDPLEREADAAAEQVMRMPEPAVPLSQTPIQLHRMCAACEDEEQLRGAFHDGHAVKMADTEAQPIVHDASAMVLQMQPNTEDVGTQDGGTGNVGADGLGLPDDGAASQAANGPPVTPESGPCNESLQNTGTGLTGNRLGGISTGVIFANAVEIQFRFDFSSFPGFRFKPVQWAGPDAVWVKRGDPLSATWDSPVSHPAGTGPDDPLEDVIFRGPNVVAFYDSPGPYVYELGAGNFSRYVVMFDFTASVVGDPMPGGATQRVCQDIAWHSIVSLANLNWNTPDAGPNWNIISGSEADIGWVDITKPPVV